MQQANWITYHLGKIKEDISTADKFRQQQGFFHSGKNDFQALPTQSDVTVLLKNCFAPLLDPSIRMIKCEPDTPALYILREHLQYDFPDSEYKLEVYTPDLAADVDCESIDEDENELRAFIHDNILHLYEISERLHDAKLDIFDSLILDSIEDKLFLLCPDFVNLINLFGNQAKAYKWYAKLHQLETLKDDWSFNSHSFFKVIKDIKKIAEESEYPLNKKISKTVYDQLRASTPFIVNEDDAPANGWEQIGYLAVETGFEYALSDVEAKVLECFKALPKEEQLLLHYHLIDPDYMDLSVSDSFTDISAYTDECLEDYLRSIANQLTSKAYTEWDNKINSDWR